MRPAARGAVQVPGVPRDRSVPADAHHSLRISVQAEPCVTAVAARCAVVTSFPCAALLPELVHVDDRHASHHRAPGAAYPRGTPKRRGEIFSRVWAGRQRRATPVP